MTTIRLTVPANIAGGDHDRGDVVEVDTDCAAMMADLGRAVIVKAELEREVRAVPETAARTTARSRARTGRPRETRSADA